MEIGACRPQRQETVIGGRNHIVCAITFGALDHFSPEASVLP